MLLIGAPYSSSVDSHGNVVQSSGALYVFTLQHTNWILTSKLSANEPESGALFGSAVSYSKDHVWVGASADSIKGVVRSGALYSIDVEKVFSNSGSANEEHLSVASIIIILVILPLCATLCYCIWWQESSKELELHTPLDIEKKIATGPEIESSQHKPYEVFYPPLFDQLK